MWLKLKLTKWTSKMGMMRDKMKTTNVEIKVIKWESI